MQENFKRFSYANLKFFTVDSENIAIQVAGKIPMRDEFHSTKGRYPTLSFLQKTFGPISEL